MLKKDLAGFFAFFLGIFGVHRFYLGQWWRGVAQFAGFWLTISFLAEEGPEMPAPIILLAFILGPIITGIIFWSMPYERWAARYDPAALTARAQQQVSAPSPAALKAEGVKYYRAGDYDLAVEAFEEARQATPDDPVVHFNLACCYSLLGQQDKALQALEVSISYGLPKPSRIEAHPALRELRKNPLFAKFRGNNYRQLDLMDLRPEELELDPIKDPVVEPDAEEPSDKQMNPDLLEQIARLRELHDAGILTQLEYKRQREKLLS